MPLQGSFQGVYPILATPFDDRENIDLESFGRLVRFMADIGVDGVTILGVLGESGRMVDTVVPVIANPWDSIARLYRKVDGKGFLTETRGQVQGFIMLNYRWTDHGVATIINEEGWKDGQGR